MDLVERSTPIAIRIQRGGDESIHHRLQPYVVRRGIEAGDRAHPQPDHAGGPPQIPQGIRATPRRRIRSSRIAFEDETHHIHAGLQRRDQPGQRVEPIGERRIDLIPQTPLRIITAKRDRAAVEDEDTLG